MPETLRQQSQQNIEGRVGNDIIIGFCVIQSCKKPLIKKYHGLMVCSLPSDCYQKRLSEIASLKQKADYAEDMTQQRKLIIRKNNMGIGYASLERLERACSERVYSQPSQSPTF